MMSSPRINCHLFALKSLLMCPMSILHFDFPKSSYVLILFSLFAPDLCAQDVGQTVRVQEKVVKGHFSSNGVLVAPNQVQLSSSILGKIVEMNVEEDSRVEQGQLIARLDSELIDVQMEKVATIVASAQARLDRAGAGARPQEINQAQAGLTRAEAALLEATTDLKRYDLLFRKKSATLKELEAYRTRYRFAVQDVNTAREQLALLEAGAREEDVEIARRGMAEAQIEELILRTQKKKTIIESPISGVVVHKLMHKGEVASPGHPLIQIVDTSILDAEINVEETYIDSLSVGYPGEVLVDAVPGEIFPGKITAISFVSSEQLKLSLLKEEEDIKRFRVKIRLENSQGRLRAGMSVKGRFAVERKGLFVEREAVRYKGGVNVVQILRGSRVIEKSVELGFSEGPLVQIVDGVMGGENLQLWQP